MYNDGSEKERSKQGSRYKTLPGIQLTRPVFKLATFGSTDAKVILTLIVSWFMVVHFGERSYVKLVINRCRTKVEEGTHQIALIADPQIVDGNSYPGRPDVINYFVKKVTDNYLHRNYRFMQHLLDPDTTIFLGDLFDGGREWGDKLWFEEYRRFQEIFPVRPNRRTIESIPGNHDIGFESIDLDTRKRFAAFFGPNNDYIQLADHNVVLLDSISLSSEDPAINRDANDFLNNIPSLLNSKYPTVLLTHVPLFRDNKAQLCGDKRESNNPFPVQKGKQYQTVINPELTEKILDMIKPVLIFAGDDHDYCEIHHQLPSGFLAKEITVKSAAMSAGIKYPAIQLLTLHNSLSVTSGPTYDTQMCYMPNPVFPIVLYVIWLIVCLGILAVNCYRQSWLVGVFGAIEAKLVSDTSLPIFNRTTTKTNYSKEGQHQKFIVSSVIMVVIAYCTIGFYYRSI